MRAALIAVLLVVGCKKDQGKAADQPAVAPVPSNPSTVGEARKVPIEANKEGFVPDKIPGKPGEKLVLVFTRTIDAECLARIKVPGNAKEIELPLNKPVEVAITVPKDGEVKFACWMDMFTGVVVAEKG
jgi:plastocyanin domain-containing protein